MRRLNKATTLEGGRYITRELEDQPSPVQDVPHYTTAQLTNINSQANKDKYLGKPVVNDDTNNPLWGGGNNLNSPWVDGTGATVHTVS